jgi:glycosyltransferase involved in cell wall biosynthesis
MNRLPKVTIGMPCYNGGIHLAPALESALNQDYGNLEVIYVDDASTDGSLQVARDLAKRYSNLKVVENPKNLGLHGCWNRVLTLCDGDYVKLLCADDLVYPGAIARQVAIMESHPNVVALTSDSDVVDYLDRLVYRRRVNLPKDRSVSKQQVVEACIAAGTNVVGEPSIVLMRGSAVRSKGGFNADFKYVIDLDYVLSLLDHGDLWVESISAAAFRMHPGSLTHQGLDKAEAELTRCFRLHSSSQFDELDMQRRIRRKRWMKSVFLSLIGNSLGRAVLRGAARMAS